MRFFAASLTRVLARCAGLSPSAGARLVHTAPCSDVERGKETGCAGSRACRGWAKAFLRTDNELFRPHHLRSAWHATVKTYRVLTAAVLIAGFLFAALVLTVRYYLLPDINRYREPIAAAISKALNQKVTIGVIEGSWAGSRPNLSMSNVVIHDQQDRPALELAEVNAQVAWRSLLVGELRMHSLIIEQPDLVVRRDREGRLFVAGVPISISGEESGFTQWLLEQVEVQVSRARVAWLDEQRGAPPLMLTDVELQLDNKLGRHKLSARALPAAEYGTALEFSGDFRREANAGLNGWLGRAYVRCAYLNLGAIKTWVDLPVEFEKGGGAFDVWADVGEKGVDNVVADVRAVRLSAKLAADTPPLDLRRLQGRLSWRALANGFEGQVQQLALMTTDGRVMPATNLSVRRMHSKSGNAFTEVQSNLVDFAMVREFASRLPLDGALRNQVAQRAPRGRLEQLKASWEGPANAPKNLRIEAHANRVALAPVGKMPGFSGVSGQIRVSPEGGTVVIDSQNAMLAVPSVLASPVSIDALKAQVEWTMVDGLPRVLVKQASFANADAAGQLSATYTAMRGGPGKIDLTGSLSRAQAQSVWKYVPLIVHEHVRDWLKNGLKAGYSNDTKFTLRGNLRDFPFDEEKLGLFEVVSQPKAVTLEYVPGWPALENAEGKLLFRARRMEIEAAGNILGARVNRSSIIVSDLSVPDQIVEIAGEASGPSQSYLRYLNQSGLSKLVGGITEKMQAKGEGQLNLVVKLPLRHVKDVKLQGEFTASENTLESTIEIPTLSKLTGKLEFTERNVRIKDAKAEAYGGPLSFSLSGDAADGVVISANGRATAAQLQREIGSPWLARLSGETAWKGTVTVHNKRTELSVESELKGMALNFPAPLAKAKEDGLAFKLQRRPRDRDDWVSVTLGKKLSAELAIEPGASPMKVRRGQVDLGANAKLPASAAGVSLTGATPEIDLDEWLQLAETARAKGDAASGTFEFAGADLRVGVVEVFGRTVHDLRLNIQRGDKVWVGQLASREVEGKVQWIPEGRGKLVGELRRLYLPQPQDAVASGNGESISGRDLPALDITAEDFKFGEYALGSLTLKAAPSGPGWRLDRLEIHSEDSNVVAQGGWQVTEGKPRSQMSVWMDVYNVGGFLRRIRYPDTVRDGTAKLIGDVSWQGSPQRIDYPTLSGSFTLEARKGRFLKAEPGIGKLIGILNLQALPRRVTLDFRDVFRQGFAFDEIDGDFRIVNGHVQTKKELTMVGPTARVRMDGEVDLAKETQNLRVRVMPSVSGGVAVGATILNPLVGIATFLAGKVLNDPIDQLVTFEYRVTGDLTEPVVEKVVRQPRTEKSGRE